jgi:hypothetical protein
VDGTLIEAWASQKSFQRKEDGPEDGENFHGHKRSNQTHQSRTDPDAKLYRKSSGSEAPLRYLGHTLVENRNGLIVGTYLTQADGYAERDAAVTPRVAQNDHNRRSAIDGRTTRHSSYQISQDRQSRNRSAG